MYVYDLQYVDATLLLGFYWITTPFKHKQKKTQDKRICDWACENRHVGTNYTPSHNRTYLSVGIGYLHSITIKYYKANEILNKC